MCGVGQGIVGSTSTGADSPPEEQRFGCFDNGNQSMMLADYRMKFLPLFADRNPTTSAVVLQTESLKYSHLSSWEPAPSGT